MSNARINNQWQYKTACLLLTTILLSCTAQAQLSLKRQKYDSIAARYGKEHAVYTEKTLKVVIEEAWGGLVAKSTIVEEKLFISDKSLNTFKTYEDNTTVYIPKGNDYQEYRNVYHPLVKNAITRFSDVDWHIDLANLGFDYFGASIPVLSQVFEVTAPK